MERTPMNKTPEWTEKIAEILYHNHNISCPFDEIHFISDIRDFIQSEINSAVAEATKKGYKEGFQFYMNNISQQEIDASYNRGWKDGAAKRNEIVEKRIADASYKRGREEMSKEMVKEIIKYGARISIDLEDGCVNDEGLMHVFDILVDRLEQL